MKNEEWGWWLFDDAVGCLVVRMDNGQWTMDNDWGLQPLAPGGCHTDLYFTT